MARASKPVENIGEHIRMDRIAQGLSLQGLADRLNSDRSIEVDRKFTTSWLHHLENNRAKALSTALKKGLARALSQDEGKYLEPNERLDKRKQTFAKFFDEQLTGFEQDSTLVCDFHVSREGGVDMGEMLMCLYQFLVATDGKVVAFERSKHVALPVFLAAMRSWPSVDDLNLNEVVTKVLAPSASSGFISCPVPAPSSETLRWISSKVDVYEMTADDQAAALLAEDPVHYVGVVSPSMQGGRPLKKLYYYVNPHEYGPLEGPLAEIAYRRFTYYRDLGMFSRYEYADSFALTFANLGKPYHLDFRQDREKQLAS